MSGENERRMRCAAGELIGAGEDEHDFWWEKAEAISARASVTGKFDNAGYILTLAGYTIRVLYTNAPWEEYHLRIFRRRAGVCEVLLDLECDPSSMTVNWIADDPWLPPLLATMEAARKRRARALIRQHEEAASLCPMAKIFVHPDDLDRLRKLVSNGVPEADPASGHA